jgi:hypothetical protein
MSDIKRCKISGDTIVPSDSLFALAVRLEARSRSAQGQVSALTPFLLAKAFRGELVGQEG